jgi:transposase InsO family protein
MMRRGAAEVSGQPPAYRETRKTRRARDHGIEISMDGRGRCHDNIFVERLWWTVKHEWVYLRPVRSVDGLRQLASRKLL